MRCGVVLRGLVWLVLLSGCTSTVAPSHDSTTDRASIEAALVQWPRDFNAKAFPALCDLFTDDLVLTVPDGPPVLGRSAFCDRMHRLLSDPARQYGYAPPDIREVLIDGDLATVALTWTLMIKNASGAVVDTSVEDGLDVFRRQPDGSWKIHISHAFRTNPS